MSGVFAYARRGARVGACVLALGAAGATAQQATEGNPAANSEQSAPAATAETEAKAPDTVKSADPAGAAVSAEPGTSTLPELVVDGDKTKKTKKKDKAAKNAASSSTATTASEPSTPPGVILGSAAASDTGLTTIDASNVQMRSNGIGDANSAFRDMPNVQYQNQSNGNGGTSSQKQIDTKPQLLSISGARTYENNFILNGVSITNITGPAQRAPTLDNSTPGPGASVYGMSPQNIYVPSEFIGDATIIDSNASAEYGQFLGGVVNYNLMAPPTDRYRASVSVGRETSDYANYVLATPDGDNPNSRQQPRFDKSTLAVSLGAPITNEFAFIAQASRKEAESSKPKAIQLGDLWTEENSDNVFFRFAATARTDVGKFTFDSSRTDYFQHYDYDAGRDVYLDMNTQGTSTKLEYDTNLAGLRVDDVGLGRVKLTSRAFYNTSETQNNSGSNYYYTRLSQSLLKNQATGKWTETYNSPDFSWCPGVDAATYQGTDASIRCYEGGYGNTLQSQVDYGVFANLTGDLLLGGFKIGTELKSYEGRSARLEDAYYASTVNQAADVNCIVANDPFCFEDVNQFSTNYTIYPKRDVTASLNALHSFAEIDQTIGWFNVRSGVRLDYDDYFKNTNVAPRLVGTIKPFDGVSVTGGYNRYYLGESLYYAIRDKVPGPITRIRSGTTTAGGVTTPGDYTVVSTAAGTSYRAEGLATPYSDEYTGAIGVKDRLLGGQWRFKYLERYGEEQFATETCGTNCYVATNNGEMFYRSASAEYTKEWVGLNNQAGLDAAAITGNVTWSEQRTTGGTYLLNADLNGDGTGETRRIWYNGQSYFPEQFTEVTGNLDIPVRFGATLATIWFDGFLEVNAIAGVNLGYMGVYDTGVDSNHVVNGAQVSHDEYSDRKFGATLKLDVTAQLNITEQAAIQLKAFNLTNSDQNAIANDNNPWVVGRSLWVGSALRF